MAEPAALVRAGRLVGLAAMVPLAVGFWGRAVWEIAVYGWGLW
jgi:hypothetical protein